MKKINKMENTINIQIKISSDFDKNKEGFNIFDGIDKLLKEVSPKINELLKEESKSKKEKKDKKK